MSEEFFLDTDNFIRDGQNHILCEPDPFLADKIVAALHNYDALVASVADLSCEKVDLETKLASAVEELDTLKSFVRSLNSLAFEKWHGRYFDDMFAIMDAKGDGVGVGKDAYDAWKMFVKNENK